MKTNIVAMILAGLVALAAPARGEVVRDQASGSGWTAQQAPGFLSLSPRCFSGHSVIRRNGAARSSATDEQAGKGARRVQVGSSASSDPKSRSIVFSSIRAPTGFWSTRGTANCSDRLRGNWSPNLRAAGYRPEGIDVILLTHIHGDHSGGLSIGGNLVFPNATVYVDHRDADCGSASPASQRSPRA